MTEEDAIDAIKRRWLEFWPTESAKVITGGCPYALDNISSSDGPFFARLRIGGIAREQTAFGHVGNQRHEGRGFIDVRISGPSGQGDKLVGALCARVRAIFETKRFGFRSREMGVVTHAATTNPLTNDSQAKTSWVKQVLIPFEYTEVK
jgi:hypothetical protein